MESAREMLHDQDLPMHLWVEDVRTTVYAQNRTPHRVLKNKTPEEVFSRKKPEVSHLRIFGCPVYIHISKEKRTKLDPQGKKGIFVGYSENSKAYKIYFLGFKRINISRDVTFDEESAYIKSRKIPVEDSKESKVPRIHNTTMNEANPKEYREREEPQKPVDPPEENNPQKRKPTWVREAIQGEKNMGLHKK